VKEAMRKGPLLVLVLSLLIAALGGSSYAVTDTGAGRSIATVQVKDTRTYIHVRGRGRYAATCGPFLTYSMVCDADWSTADYDVWAIRLNQRRWGVGAESFTERHIIIDVTRVRAGLWRLVVDGDKGSIRRHYSAKPTRWDVYRNGRMIGYTSGPHGVGAASMWIVFPLDSF
jgi:hypothetical protein